MGRFERAVRRRDSKPPLERVVRNPHLGRVRIRALTPAEAARVLGPMPPEATAGLTAESASLARGVGQALRAATLGVVDPEVRERLKLADDFTEGEDIRAPNDPEDALATVDIGVAIGKLSERQAR